MNFERHVELAVRAGKALVAHGRFIQLVTKHGTVPLYVTEFYLE